jgi:hypothetical protein
MCETEYCSVFQGSQKSKVAGSKEPPTLHHLQCTLLLWTGPNGILMVTLHWKDKMYPPTFQELPTTPKTFESPWFSYTSTKQGQTMSAFIMLPS